MTRTGDELTEHTDRLKELLPNSIITDRRIDLEAYRDIGYPDSRTRLVIRPTSYDDVSTVLRYCSENGIAIVPWGGGTNLCGALTPSRECIALDLKSLNSVLSISREDWHVTVQAGTTIEDVERSVNKDNFTFCHDPWSRRSSTVGGALSLDSVGNFYPKFGSIGKQVLSMKVALANGQIIRVGRNITKSSTSPFLPGLFIGAEGIFGIILEATLTIQPLPETQATMGFAFSSFSDLSSGITELRKSGLEPQSYIGGTVPEKVEKLQPKSERMLVKLLKIDSALFLYYDGLSGEVKARVERANEILGKLGRRMPDKYALEWWENRHTFFEMSPEIAEEGIYVHVFDLCVPNSAVLKMAEQAEGIAKELELGDGISHTLFGAVDAYTIALYVDDTSEGRSKVKEFEKKVVPLVHSNGGTVSRTHGLGTLFDDKCALEEIGEDGLYLLKGLKRFLDPKGILNPGIIHRGP